MNTFVIVKYVKAMAEYKQVGSTGSSDCAFREDPHPAPSLKKLKCESQITIQTYYSYLNYDDEKSLLSKTSEHLRTPSTSSQHTSHHLLSQNTKN